MKAVHVMKDGSVRDSIDGVMIQSKDFYEILNVIIRKSKRSVENDR